MPPGIHAFLALDPCQGDARQYNPPAEERTRVEDIEETLEDEELDEEVVEPDEADAAPAAAVPPGEDVESIQDVLAKQEAKADEEEDESVLSLTREDRLEPLAVKVVPPQPTEFICSNCFLVKHRSQLKDKAKMLCRDCA
jgi:hypothetical protein